MTKQQILDTAKQLPREEQIDLALEFWDAVHVSELDLPLTADQQGELDRRMVESDSNPQPIEDVQAIKDRLLRGEL